MAENLCADCGQPMLPPGETKRPNEYDHANGCPKGIPTTIGGIVDMIRQTNGVQKCGATKMVGNGISFCTQPKGHDGKHGNGRKTWGKATASRRAGEGRGGE